MARRSDFDATITKQGYKSRTIHVTRAASADGIVIGVVGNAILGGVIGVGVDLATGAMYDLTPSQVNVALEKDTSAPVADLTTYSDPRPATHSAPIYDHDVGYRSIPACGQTAYRSLCVQIRPSYSE